MSGAELHVSATPHSGWYTSLAEAVNAANTGDIIIIEDEEFISADQIVLATEKEVTITNARGKNVIISSDFEAISDGADWSDVDEFTLFVINAGTLTLEGNPLGGMLTITTNHNGRGFDVNYDDRSVSEGGSWWGGGGDNKPAHLIMKPGVCIVECGFGENFASTNHGGAVYVRQDGTFTMEGGVLAENCAGAGGAIYVVDDGHFQMTGGLITENQALDGKSYSASRTYGGGLWMADVNCLVGGTIGGTIDGNTSAKKPGNNQEDYNEIYCPGFNWEILGVVQTSVTEDKTYKSLTAALAATAGHSSVKLYLLRDYSQVKIEKWDSIQNKYTNSLEILEITKEVTIMPLNTDVSLFVQGEKGANGGMFIVPNSGTLTFTGGSHNLHITQSEYGTESSLGGLVYLDGGSLTIDNKVTISDLQAEKGDVVYVNRGIFTVSGSISIDENNDIYLAKDQVITASPGFAGSIGKITLPEYIDGTRVVYIGSDKSGYPDQFLMNQEGITNGFNRVLEIGEYYPTYLVLVVPDFKIVIPSKLVVEEGNGMGTMDIQATVLHIPKKASVVVTFDSKYDFTLAYLRKTTGIVDPTIFLNYELRLDGNLIQKEGEITTFSMDSPNPRTLAVTVLDTPVYAGEYVDTLTFTIQYFSGSTS